MIKYYIPEILLNQLRNIPNLINSLNEEFISDEKNEKIILTIDGFYKIIDNKIEKFKYISNNSRVIENFYKDFSLIGEDIYEKKINYITHIPYENETIEIKTIKYKTVEKSTNFMVFEIIDNRIKDFYFLSEKKLDEDNIFFQNDISLFLNSLNV